MEYVLTHTATHPKIILNPPITPTSFLSFSVILVYNFFALFFMIHSWYMPYRGIGVGDRANVRRRL